MLVWMLGLSPDKAQGTALCYAVFASAAAVVTRCLVADAPASPWLAGAMLVVGGMVGAIVAAPLAGSAASNVRRKLWLTVGMFVCLATAALTVHSNPWEPVGRLAGWQSPGQVFVLGLAVGALARYTLLPSGILMVPALHFVGGFAPRETMWLSLLAVAVGSLMPARAYATRGYFDAVYGRAAVLGGIAGGALGAWALWSWRVGEAAPLFVFAFLGMFTAGREFYKIVWEEMPAR
jgi:uncharacterized membrane protein YfcA